MRALLVTTLLATLPAVFSVLPAFHVLNDGFQVPFWALASAMLLALQWLSIAIHHDPSLAGTARTEPDFATLRGLSDYRRTTRGPSWAQWVAP